MAEKNRSYFKYGLTSKETDEFRRKRKPPKGQIEEFSLADVLRRGYVPSFYAYGGGLFGQKYSGSRPMPVESSLVPFFEGDIMEVTGDGETAFLAPYTDEFNDLMKQARKGQTLRAVSAQISRQGGSYGLHPYKGKRATPFTISEESLERFMSGKTGGD